MDPHAILVYFGLRRDPAMESRFANEPMNAWRMAAVTVGLLLLLVLAVGLLLVSGVGSFVRAIVWLIELAAVAWVVWRIRLRAGTRDRCPS
jgi:protein-S-isoprenylcysteine O-methyltransferase Ste14